MTDTRNYINYDCRGMFETIGYAIRCNFGQEKAILYIGKLLRDPIFSYQLTVKIKPVKKAHYTMHKRHDHMSQ